MPFLFRTMGDSWARGEGTQPSHNGRFGIGIIQIIAHDIDITRTRLVFRTDESGIGQRRPANNRVVVEETIIVAKFLDTVHYRRGHGLGFNRGTIQTVQSDAGTDLGFLLVSVKSTCVVRVRGCCRWR